MNIGDRIRDYRKQIPLTMKELGKSLGVSEQAISQYELGKRTPSLEVLIKISKVFSISYSELIRDTNIELDNTFNELDKIGKHIQEREIKYSRKYKQLYESINEMLESYDYNVPEYESQKEDFEDLRITISDLESKESVTITQNDYVKLGEKMLNDIEMYKKMRVMYFLRELKNN
ncbi:helix-turn-helix domain-containing protein [Clostridium botulinum]|nr:helix-turn-helix domain-containing protein [Clostridium botulinum]